MVGILLAAISASRTITFFAMGQKKLSQHHSIPLTAAFLAGALGAAMVYAFCGHAAYMAGFLLIGIAQGIGYTASLFYSLDSGGKAGSKTGIHEAMVSSGVMAGAFLGGHNRREI